MNDNSSPNDRMTEQDNARVYVHLAHALARGYTDLYYVNMDTDEFIEFHTDDVSGVLTEARRGADFFEGCERDAQQYVHAEDRAAFVRAMDRDFLSRELDSSKVFELVYRRLLNGRAFYVRMKVTRMEDDPRFIVIAVSDVDELMRQRRMEARIAEERVIYARLHALTGNFIVVYVVDPVTNRYREFSATDDYVESFSQAKEGTDFFGTVREAALSYNYPEDIGRFLTAFTKENVLSEVDRSGIFTLDYRVMMEGQPLHIQLKAAMVEEREGRRLVVGLNNIDAQVRQREEFGRRLAQAQNQANIDAVTGIKNKHAYLAAAAQLDRRIAEEERPPFAVVMFDVNDLKKVNDRLGHQAGDQYLRDASRIICDIFSHSPVFRIGGDEFAAISQGRDYENVDALVDALRIHNEQARRSGGIVIASGMSRCENDEYVAAVFERADKQMYENKAALKRAAGV